LFYARLLKSRADRTLARITDITLDFGRW